MNIQDVQRVAESAPDWTHWAAGAAAVVSLIWGIIQIATWWRKRK